MGQGAARNWLLHLPRLVAPGGRHRRRQLALDWRGRRAAHPQQQPFPHRLLGMLPRRDLAQRPHHRSLAAWRRAASRALAVEPSYGKQYQQD